MTKKQHTKARFAVMTGATLTLILISLLFGLAWPVLLTQAGPTLPPRDPPPAAPSTNDDDGGRDRVPIAYIDLKVQSAPAGAWTVVQWLGKDGNWHDVDGWWSSLPSNGIQGWVVEAKDFNTGPFRWAVTQGKNGSVIATSDSFTLPGVGGQILLVSTSVQ